MERLRGFGLGGRILIGLAVGGAIFGIASVVQADIPDGGTINACYGKANGGTLRVIDTSKRQKCAFNENPLSWNATGVSGATGPTGPTGPIGPTGPGATTFTATLPQVAVDSPHTLVTLSNGVKVTGECTQFGGGAVFLGFAGGNLDGTGVNIDSAGVAETNTFGTTNFASGSATFVGFNVAMRDTTANGKFAHIDAHASYGSPCTFSGMITPSN
jgi:hypothetical protein